MATVPDTARPAPAGEGGFSWRRIRASLTREEWASLGTMAAFILALHLIGWFTLVVIVAPEHYSVGSRTFGIGMGVTAYTLGMRHAFDADHIAAIDHTTRKLMSEGRGPLSVGFWFSLGHSSVVFALTFLLSLGVKALAGPTWNGDSGLHAVAGWIGVGLIAEKAHLHGPFRDRIAGVDLNTVGYVVVALFFVTWVIALLVWRLARIEEKWTVG